MNEFIECTTMISDKYARPKIFSPRVYDLKFTQVKADRLKTTILITLLLAKFNVFSTPLTHTVTYNVTTHVTCEAGDTLKFYGTFSGDYIVAVNSLSVINPTMVTSPFYIGHHIVVAGDTTFTISEISQGPKFGTINVLVTTGFSSYDIKDEFNVFPNPMENILKIRSAMKENIQVYNASGALVKVFSIEERIEEVDFNDLSPGIYFIRTQRTAIKLIKN
jgi:hypothetical protein